MIVEWVWTMVPLLAMIFAFLNFGLLLFRWSTLQNAVREGARYAVTFQPETGKGQDASIEDRVQMFAMGFVRADDTPQHIFVKYYSQAGTQVTSSGNQPGNVVQVSVEGLPLNWSVPWMAPLMMGTVPTFSLNIYSSDVLGGLPYGVTSVTE